MSKSEGGVKRVIVVRPDESGRMSDRKVFLAENDDNGFVVDGMEFAFRDASGRVRRGVLREALGPRKKQSRLLRPLERAVRKAARRQVKALSIYLGLHDRSNRKKRNGWISDLGSNFRKVVKNA